MERVGVEGEMGIKKSEGIRDEIQSAGVILCERKREREGGMEGEGKRGRKRRD